MKWNTIKVAAKNLLLHKLRSLLALLGVILGVGSVIAMLAVGEGSKEDALERIRRLGASNVIIRSVTPMNDGGDARLDVVWSSEPIETKRAWTQTSGLRATYRRDTDHLARRAGHVDRH